MKTTTFLFTTILLFIIGTTTYASFEKGFIITHRQDTIQGFINVNSWTVSPKTIEFKDTNGSVKTLSTNDLAAFYVNYTNEWYVSKVFEIEVWHRSLKELPSYISIGQYANRTKQMQQIESFVRVISRGNINLYVYNPEQLIDRHYIIEKNGKVIPLIYHVALADGGKKDYNVYQTQLKEILGGEAINVSYEENALKKLIDKYNQSQDNNSKPLLSPRFGKIYYGALLNISADAWYNQTNATLPNVLASSNSFGPGAFINFMVGKRRGTFSIFTDVYYHQFDRSIGVKSRGYDLTLSASQKGLKLFQGLQYSYDLGKVGVFAEAGVYAFIPFQRAFTERYVSNGVEHILSFKPFKHGSAIGVGVKLRRIAISVRLGSKAFASAPIYGDKAYFQAHSLNFKYNINK